MSRNTDPPRNVVRRVRRRDGDACIICGTQRNLTTQHRVPRGMGGTHLPWINRDSNLITLCGSGTTGCHGWVENHPTFAKEAGWAVSHSAHPADVPVLYADGWWLLTDDGRRVEANVAGHAGRGGRGWGQALNDQDMGGSWPPAAPREARPEDALRPWGSPARSVHSG